MRGYPNCFRLIAITTGMAMAIIAAILLLVSDQPERRIIGIATIVLTLTQWVALYPHIADLIIKAAAEVTKVDTPN